MCPVPGHISFYRHAKQSDKSQQLTEGFVCVQCHLAPSELVLIRTDVCCEEPSLTLSSALACFYQRLWTLTWCLHEQIFEEISAEVEHP